MKEAAVLLVPTPTGFDVRCNSCNELLEHVPTERTAFLHAGLYTNHQCKKPSDSSLLHDDADEPSATVTTTA
jgi:hypothetical protein